MSKFITTKFWADATERAVSTAAQAAVATLGAGIFGILDVDWVNVASISGFAAVLSILKALAASGKGDPDSASLIG